MWKHKSGYWRLKIMVDGKWKNESLHRYVWELYNGPIPEGFAVHHKNGNKNCNCICNLELVSYSEHSHYHALHRSIETREKISIAKSGKTLSEETRHKISEAGLGNRNAVGNTVWRGRCHTEEAKKKQSEARKRYWKNRKASLAQEHQDNLSRKEAV